MVLSVAEQLKGSKTGSPIPSTTIAPPSLCMPCRCSRLLSFGMQFCPLMECALELDKIRRQFDRLSGVVVLEPGRGQITERGMESASVVNLVDETAVPSGMWLGFARAISRHI